MLNKNIIYDPFSKQPQHPNGVGYLAKKIGLTDQFGFFAFIDAVYDKRFYEEPYPENTNEGITRRCDSSAPRQMPMPVDFHEWDYEKEICTACGSKNKPYGTTNSHVASLNNCKILRMPVQSTHGFITYIEINDSILEEQAFVDPQNCARTLQELFRLMLEWEWAHDHLGNRERIAVVAKNMIQELDMPEDVRNWLWNELPSMRLAKFILGESEPRSRADLSLIPDMSESFEAWCLQIILGRDILWTYGTH
jgi:hypothetical protein